MWYFDRLREAVWSRLSSVPSSVVVGGTAALVGAVAAVVAVFAIARLRSSRPTVYIRSDVQEETAEVA